MGNSNPCRCRLASRAGSPTRRGAQRLLMRRWYRGQGIEQPGRPVGFLPKVAPIGTPAAADIRAKISQAFDVVPVRGGRVSKHDLPILPTYTGQTDPLCTQLDAHLVEKILHHLG